MISKFICQDDNVIKWPSRNRNKGQVDLHEGHDLLVS
jgi:hypothetical protein